MKEIDFYIIAGLPGSQRRAIVADLIEGSNEPAPAAVYLSSAEAKDEATDKLAGVSNVMLKSWTYHGEHFQYDDLPENAGQIFWLLDGRTNLIDQLELLSKWLKKQPFELARVISVIHCKAEFEHSELKAWNDACAHFSDVLLLNRREELPNKWMKALTDRYKKEHLPCLIEFVKKGRVSNPPLVLEAQARRVSQLFDEMTDLDAIDFEVEFGEDDDELPEEPFDLEHIADPWLERLPGGQRRKKLPDLNKLFPQ